MDLTNVATIDEWIELEKEIHERSGIGVNVFNAQGIRITGNHIPSNRLCPAIKATDSGQSSICAVAHMNLAEQAKRTRKPVVEECDAGMLKLVAPVFSGDTYLGAVSACGLLLDDGEVDSFLVNKITGIDEDEVETLSEGIKAVSTEQAEELGSIIMNRISEMIK